MVSKSVLFAAVIALSGISGVQAQSLRATDGPAEIPPASFTSSQYIDSRGCVFIRAGYGGNTVWVPRVTRDRNLLCGMTPSIAGSAATSPEPIVEITSSTPISAPTNIRRTSGIIGTARPSTGSGTNMPSGFRAAWTDGRLNSSRGPRTQSGNAQMAMVWTDTVPRKLIPAN